MNYTALEIKEASQRLEEINRTVVNLDTEKMYLERIVYGEELKHDFSGDGVDYKGYSHFLEMKVKSLGRELQDYRHKSIFSILIKRIKIKLNHVVQICKRIKVW